MDVLKAEIARKRKLLDEKQLLDPARKYFKRADLLAAELEERRRRHGAQGSAQGSAPAHGEQGSAPQRLTQDAHDVSASGSPSGDAGERGEAGLARGEVVRRLRERGHPVLLFAESEAAAFRRLRRLEIQEPEANKGLRNDFQEAMGKVDQAYLDEFLALGTQSGADKVSAEEESAEDGVTYELIQQLAEKMGRGDRHVDMRVIMLLLQFLLKLWGQQLNSASGTEKTSTKHKMARATYTQTQVYLRPLLRKLNNRSLPEDICDSLTEITRHLLERNYIMASDAYLQMAIGNAPWPIGVTMVGIHARTGREKIFSKNVAHVMNDETQRKYIQALKRLMTKCQEYFPTDPSRCVEYSTPS